mmetsp:Transcript_37626/g.111649  ORF Transcript_37626/g.111649 Transcript_37626/m.111649 type:complete len:487 (+) Transcript_37626:100-1560(+)
MRQPPRLAACHPTTCSAAANTPAEPPCRARVRPPIATMRPRGNPHGHRSPLSPQGRSPRPWEREPSGSDVVHVADLARIGIRRRRFHLHLAARGILGLGPRPIPPHPKPRLLRSVLVGGDDDDRDCAGLGEVEGLVPQADVGDVEDGDAERAASRLRHRREVLERQPGDEAVADDGRHRHHRVVVPAQVAVAVAPPPRQLGVAGQRAPRRAEDARAAAEELRERRQAPAGARQRQDQHAGDEHHQLNPDADHEEALAGLLVGALGEDGARGGDDRLQEGQLRAAELGGRRLRRAGLRRGAAGAGHRRAGDDNKLTPLLRAAVPQEQDGHNRSNQHLALPDDQEHRGRGRVRGHRLQQVRDAVGQTDGPEAEDRPRPQDAPRGPDEGAVPEDLYEEGQDDAAALRNDHERHGKEGHHKLRHLLLRRVPAHAAVSRADEAARVCRADDELRALRALRGEGVHDPDDHAQQRDYHRATVGRDPAAHLAP